MAAITRVPDFGLGPFFRIGRPTKLCDTVFRLRNISNISALRVRV
jgi:hypothetical protein